MLLKVKFKVNFVDVGLYFFGIGRIIFWILLCDMFKYFNFGKYII